jgi:hypothetical protein
VSTRQGMHYRKGDTLDVRGNDGTYTEVLNLTKARIASAAVDLERERVNELIEWTSAVEFELVEGSDGKPDSWRAWCRPLGWMGTGQTPLDALSDAVETHPDRIQEDRS